MHVSCIKTQEVDGEVLGACDRVVLHNRRQAKAMHNVMSGTRTGPERDKGWWNDGTVKMDFPDIGDLLAGRAQGRQRTDEITCFVNNVGTGLQFAAAGAFVLEKAREQAVGTRLPDDWFSEDVHP